LSARAGSIRDAALLHQQILLLANPACRTISSALWLLSMSLHSMSVHDIPGNSLNR